MCDDFWDRADAQVVCRQLGYSTNNARVYKAAYFGQGTGTIHMSNVRCYGNESSLFDCTSERADRCSHSEDAGVKCGSGKFSKVLIMLHV